MTRPSPWVLFNLVTRAKRTVSYCAEYRTVVSKLGQFEYPGSLEPQLSVGSKFNTHSPQTWYGSVFK